MGTQVDPALALEMLNTQSKQFEQQIVQTADNVYTAVGYHGANTSMIVGTDGIIIVDTLMGPESASNAFKAFREISQLPVKAVVLTHSHYDHTGGVAVFAEDGADIYALEGFGSAEINPTAGILGPILRARGIRQFGRKLPDADATNRGLAPAKTIDHDHGKGYLPPTILVPTLGLTTTIAGIDLQFHAGPGETDDAMFVWLPKEQVLFSGDNFYHTFPNLYAIRGTPYRDVRKWADSLTKMAQFQPEILIPGHTLPVTGADATTALQNYSAAIRSVYDQTITGINQGKTADIIAQEVSLPSDIKNKPYLTEFYGAIPHAVRAICAGLLGWFDGNPTTLNPLHPKIKAKEMANLAGGTQALTQKMQDALAQEQFQWALELSDYVSRLDDGDKPLARSVKITALRALAAREYNAPNRNYYLSYANELESGQLEN